MAGLPVSHMCLCTGPNSETSDKASVDPRATAGVWHRPRIIYTGKGRLRRVGPYQHHKPVRDKAGALAPASQLLLRSLSSPPTNSWYLPGLGGNSLPHPRLTLLYRKTPRMAVIMPRTLVLVTGFCSMIRDTVMTMILLVALATE